MKIISAFLFFLLNIHTWASELSVVLHKNCPSITEINIPQTEEPPSFWHITAEDISDIPIYIKAAQPLKKAFKIAHPHAKEQGKPDEIWILGNKNKINIHINIFNPEEAYSMVNLFRKKYTYCFVNRFEQYLTVTSPTIEVQSLTYSAQKFLNFCSKHWFVPYCLFQTLAQEFSPQLVQFLKTAPYIEKSMFLPQQVTQKNSFYRPFDPYLATQRIMDYLENLEKYKIIQDREEKYFILKTFIDFFSDKNQAEYALLTKFNCSLENFQKKAHICELLKNNLFELHNTLSQNLNFQEQDSNQMRNTLHSHSLKEKFSKFLRKVRAIFPKARPALD